MSNEPKKNLKHALLMNVLMPGSGYYLLGMKLRCTLIISAVLILVIIPIARFTFYSMQLTINKPISSKPMLSALMDVLKTAWLAQRFFIITCALAILALWIYSIVDVAVRMKNSSSE